MSFHGLHRRITQALTSRPHLPIAIYLALAGWHSLISGGAADREVVPIWLGLMWAASVAFGGTLATVGCLGAATRTESAGLGLLLYGAAVYGGIFGVSHGFHWQAIVLGLAVMGMCAIRIHVLTQARRARQAAFRITQKRGV